MRPLALVITSALIVLTLSACNQSRPEHPPMTQPSSPQTNASSLAFTCIHEANQFPTLDIETDKLFQYARWLQKQSSPQDTLAIGRFYRIAAANGHYKASNNLINLISVGSVESPDAPREVVDMAQELIKQRIPSGYYAMGHFLEVGYGVNQDREKAFAYIRKAADLGSPDGQYYIAELLEPIDRAPAVARQMRQCATDQGHIKASIALATDFQTDKNYLDAVQAYQKGVRNGSSQAAQALSESFKGPAISDPIDYLALAKDDERAKRYDVIAKFLRRYDGRNPKVPDIDKIVPLPPAPLPAWDGTFEWEKEFKSAKAPEMPSEALIKKLAQAKGLDPLTGLPLAKGK